MGFYVVCPFYKSDSRSSISCEDCIRLFPDKKKKRRHIREFCEDMENYKNCPWACALLEMYKEMDDMKMSKEQREIRAAMHIADARGKENESLRLQIGHLQAKIKSLEMMCGYLSDVALDFSSEDEAKIEVKKMCEFFGKYEVDWAKNDGEYIYVRKRVKKGS